MWYIFVKIEALVEVANGKGNYADTDNINAVNYFRKVNESTSEKIKKSSKFKNLIKSTSILNYNIFRHNQLLLFYYVN
jgi:hypothetical protein